MLKTPLFSQDVSEANVELSGIIDAIPSLVFLIDCVEKKIGFRNREFNRFFQVENSETVMLEDISSKVLHTDRQIYEDHFESLANSVLEQPIQSVFQMLNAEGNLHWVKFRSVVYESGEDGNPKLTLHLVEDVTEHHQYLREHVYWSTHDFLTGLVNRGYFEAQANKITSGEYGQATILMIDVDGLKSINDYLGHSYGDEVLRIATNVLRTIAREGDTVARIGGDEFAMLLVGINEDDAVSNKDQLQALFDERTKAWNNRELGLSIGISTLRSGTSYIEAMHQADEKMYHDKASRKLGLRTKGSG